MARFSVMKTSMGACRPSWSFFWAMSAWCFWASALFGWKEFCWKILLFNGPKSSERSLVWWIQIKPVSFFLLVSNLCYSLDACILYSSCLVVWDGSVRTDVFSQRMPFTIIRQVTFQFGALFFLHFNSYCIFSSTCWILCFKTPNSFKGVLPFSPCNECPWKPTFTVFLLNFSYCWFLVVKWCWFKHQLIASAIQFSASIYLIYFIM